MKSSYNMCANNAISCSVFQSSLYLHSQADFASAYQTGILILTITGKTLMLSLVCMFSETVWSRILVQVFILITFSFCVFIFKTLYSDKCLNNSPNWHDNILTKRYQQIKDPVMTERTRRHWLRKKTHTLFYSH